MRYLLLLSILLSLMACHPSIGMDIASGGIDTTFTPQTALTPYPGELLWKARWEEGKRHYIFLLSHQLNYQDGDGYDALFARRFVENGKTWTPQWSYRDTVLGYGCDLNVLWQPQFSGIQDLNGDGRQEVFFTYLHANRCDAGMVDTRLVVNRGPQSGRIIGVSQIHLEPPQHVFNQFLKENGQDTIQYKQIEPSLSNLGGEIEQKASEIWDQLLKWQASRAND